MSPIVGYHASTEKCRDSIRNIGLLPSQIAGRPYGVYMFRDDGDFDHNTFGRAGAIRWGAYGGPYGSDCWLGAYIGPIAEDHYVENGLIFLGPVPYVTLVTGNN